jgi:hypothetical protein
MKLYSQMGVSSSRNSPYFLYKSYVTCGTGRWQCEWRTGMLAAHSAPHLVAAAVVPHVLAHDHHRGVALEFLRCAVAGAAGKVRPWAIQP